MPWKFLALKYFREQSQEKFFLEPDFVEVRNFQLQVCNVKEKGAILDKGLFEIFEILEQRYPSKHIRRKYLKWSF